MFAAAMFFVRAFHIKFDQIDLRDSELNNKFIKKWERNINKGKILYILIYCATIGVASLGGALIVYIITGKISFDNTLWITIGSLIGGAIMGVAMWYSNEEKYKTFVNAD